jgi:hypothetical protein
VHNASHLVLLLLLPQVLMANQVLPRVFHALLGPIDQPPWTHVPCALPELRPCSKL